MTDLASARPQRAHLIPGRAAGQVVVPQSRARRGACPFTSASMPGNQQQAELARVRLRRLVVLADFPVPRHGDRVQAGALGGIQVLEDRVMRQRIDRIALAMVVQINPETNHGALVCASLRQAGKGPRPSF